MKKRSKYFIFLKIKKIRSRIFLIFKNIKYLLKNNILSNKMTEEEKKYTCEFCNNEYKSISSLNHHKKTVKKCLILRDALNTAHFFQCKTCEFKTTLKNNFNSHKCKLKDISEYKNTVSNLEEELKLKTDNILKLESDLKLSIEKEKLSIEKLNIIEKENKIYLEKIEKLKNKNILLKTELIHKFEKHETQLFTLASKPP